MVVFTRCTFLQHPAPVCESTVAEDTIYCAGKPFAKLWTIDPDCFAQETLFATHADSGLGLVTHYYSNDEEVWMHPNNALSVYQGGKEYNKIEAMQSMWKKIRHEAREESHGTYQQDLWPAIHIRGRRMEKEDLIRSGVFNVKTSNDGTCASNF